MVALAKRSPNLQHRKANAIFPGVDEERNEKSLTMYSGRDLGCGDSNLKQQQQKTGEERTQLWTCILVTLHWVRCPGTTAAGRSQRAAVTCWEQNGLCHCEQA